MVNRYPDVQAALGAVDESTTALGVYVKSLVDAINSTPGDGLDGPQTEWVLEKLAALKTKLDATGKPADPIPDPIPAPDPIPGGDGSNPESFRGRNR